MLLMHPEDAQRADCSDGDDVRVFNELGEVRCALQIADMGAPRDRVAAERPVAEEHLQQQHRNALAPDTLTDIAGGACFNDARVEVEKG